MSEVLPTKNYKALYYETMEQRIRFAQENEKLRARVEMLTKAVEFYADPKHWTIDWVEGSHGDYGSRARKALDEAKL